VFCKIEQETRSANGIAGVVSTDRIIYQNERLLIFPDIRPAARLHLLVVPRVHVANIRSLNALDSEDIDLVKEMESLGRAALLSLSAQEGIPLAGVEAHLLNASVDNSDLEHGFLTVHASSNNSSNALSASIKSSYFLKDLKPVSDRSLDSKLGFKFGYHVPPFRSVDHLHLHCFLLPHIPWWIRLKYVFQGIWKDAVSLEQELQGKGRVTNTASSET